MVTLANSSTVTVSDSVNGAWLPVPGGSVNNGGVFLYAFYIPGGSRGLGARNTVTVTNTGDVPAQLISRTWHINDANGVHEKVRGLGVVGHQPLLQPGQAFEYTSGTRLRTPTGTMHGSYFCVAEDGEKFDVDIPMFVLDALSEGSRRLH